MPVLLYYGFVDDKTGTYVTLVPREDTLGLGKRSPVLFLVMYCVKKVRRIRR